jgi:hypothetical protein
MAFGNLDKGSHIFGSSGGKTSFKDIKSSTPNWLTNDDQEQANSTVSEKEAQPTNTSDEIINQKQDKPVAII